MSLASGFLPPGFLPAGYFPASAPASAGGGTPTAGSNYLPVGFFPTGFLPIGYFPTGTTGPAIALPVELVDAIELHLQTLVSSSATTAAGSPLSWAGAAMAAPGDALPYLVYNEPDEDDGLVNTSGTKLARGTIEVQIFAATKVQARGLGNQVAALLESQAQAGGLAFGRGSLSYFLGSGRSLILDPDPAPGGGNCWMETRQFEFRYTYLAGI